MSIRIGLVAATCLTLAMVAPLWGCTMAAQTARVNSTHFAYPNSNITPVGEGEASTNRFCGLLGIQWSGFDHETTEALIDEAKAGADGDLLINASVSTSMTSYLLFSLCKTAVSGTVAKMEVGQQELR